MDEHAVDERVATTEPLPALAGNGQQICDHINWLITHTYIRVEYFSRYGLVEVKFVSPVGNQHMLLHGTINGHRLTVPIFYDDALLMYPARSLLEWKHGKREPGVPSWVN